MQKWVWALVMWGAALVALLVPIQAGASGGSILYLPLVTNAPPSPPWPRIALGPGIIGFEAPVYVTHAGDGSGRLYVVEQSGRIRVVEGGQIRGTPLLDIRARVDYFGEKGLLGLTFPPGPGPKDHFYVNYTGRREGGQLVTRISRFAMDPDTQLADPDSEEILLTFDQPYPNHNGGHLAFGPDGYLYIASGDGGSAGDPLDQAQDLGSLLGKILRIHVEGTTTPTYTVPITNPFVGQADARPEIWAYGLRNPWRFSFDRETGDLYIGDVGQNRWEEIDFQPANSPGGENYGWPILEGRHCYRTDPCDATGTVLPIWEYRRADGNQAVIGGYVYRGNQIPDLRGIYLFGDWASGRIWGLRRLGSEWQHALLLESGKVISSFGEDGSGQVWVVDYTGGAIYPIVSGSGR